MPRTKRRYSKQEFAQRGDAIFESDVKPRLRKKDEGKFAAIDVDTRSFVIHEDKVAACDRLRERLPEAQIWMVRVGSRYVHRFGGCNSGFTV
jgi:hypothetical protein